MDNQPEKKKRGFAAMSPEKRKEIQSLGGKTVAAKGNGHKFTSKEAINAGKKGGKATLKKYGNEHFRVMGSKGGSAKSNPVQE